jgi:hypothetical protein
MSDDLDEILDSVFHGCALAAYCHQAAEEGRFPPDSEATKQRFNRYYEEELAARNAAKEADRAMGGLPAHGNGAQHTGGALSCCYDAGVPASGAVRKTAPSTGETSAGLVGSERVRRHSHRRD